MRSTVERALRAASLALLVAVIWISLPRERAPHARVEAARSASDRVLARWTMAPPESAHVTLDSLPDRAARDWLRALRRAGTALSWSSAPLPALAVEAYVVGDPGGLVRVMSGAPAGSAVAIRDRAGVLDTLRVEAHAASATASVPAGAIRAMVGGHEAVTAVQDSVIARRVLVLGAAGWEAKFVIAALEEAGWLVDARMPVAPGVDVVQGEPRRPDTARYAAVVVLDDTPTPETAAIASYVRSGGGLVLAAGAARRPALVPLAPASLGTRVRPRMIAFAATTPRRALSVYPLVRLREGAVRLEMRDDIVTAVAMRVGAGRVTQVGYDESWRWRFAEGDDAPAAHREWWSRVVASAAYRATVPIRGATSGESAPVAALHAALGPPSAEPGSATGQRLGGGLRWWMLALLFVLLLAEWGSRRLRGAA